MQWKFCVVFGQEWLGVYEMLAMLMLLGLTKQIVQAFAFPSSMVPVVLQLLGLKLLHRPCVQDVFFGTLGAQKLCFSCPFHGKSDSDFQRTSARVLWDGGSLGS